MKLKGPNISSNLILGIFVALALIVMATAFSFAFVQFTWNAEYKAQVAEQKLLSQRIATSALEAASGREVSFNDLQQFRDQFDKSINYLLDGNSAFQPVALPSLPEEAGAELDELYSNWQEYRTNADSIVDKRETVAAIAEFVANLSNALDTLDRLTSDIALRLSESNASPQTLYVATRQISAVERAKTNLSRILTGEQDATAAADQFKRDFEFYARVLDSLINGSLDLEIKRVNSPEIQNMLIEAQDIYNKVETSVIGIVDNSQDLFEVKDAAGIIQVIAPDILELAIGLEQSISEKLDTRVLIFALIGGGGFLALAGLLALMGLFSNIAARRRAAESLSLNQRNQEAILRLLDEMTALADGDLTTHATVTEDITGAIADSVNFSIDALRTLVEAINNAVVRVFESSENTQAIAGRLADASNQQASEIATTTDAISRMARTMEKVSKNAENSADVALKSVQIAHKGAETVRRNIEGMDSIRDTIQETSKRIKRLGESSQQIGEIVSLITDIADRTNILALNAAIQASSAGDAGRGFAVVADEVQRLAERAGNATKQIAALVETIQTDTNEAVSSMEQSTAGVVTGAKLAEDAGNALTEIESVSKQLADLITSISREASEQANTAVNISESMNVIKRITMETSDGTNETAKSISNLAELAKSLRTSVAGFKLPDVTDMQTAVNE